MHVGLLQFEILVRASTSLKDKRRVVRSIKDRLHRHHQVSVAEVAALDQHRRAVLGLAAVANSAPRASEILDAVLGVLAGLREGELGEVRRSVAVSEELATSSIDEHGDPRLADASLEAELLARGEAVRDADRDGGVNVGRVR